MKIYLTACSGKVWRSYYALLYARLTPGKVFVGTLSLVLILLSFIGAFATINSPHTIAATITVAANSGMKHTLAFGKTRTPTTTPFPTSTTTPSPTSTTTPSPTSITTPTATPTMMPTPTSTSIPSPTAKPSPIPTATTVSPSPPSSTLSISPTHVASTGITNATPIVTEVSPQNSIQGQTPITKSNSNPPQSMTRQQQKNTFPFIALAIGVPGITATLVFLFIGWWLLRKHLLPNNTVQLPPSGANPWSRVRPNDARSTNVNVTFQSDDNSSQLPKSQMPFVKNSIAPTSIPFNNIVALPEIDIAPTPKGFVQANTNSLAPSLSQKPPNKLNQIPNVQLIPIPGPTTSELDTQQTLGKNGNSVTASDGYEQWLSNNFTGTPDLNDPYLKELLKQFSDKTQSTLQQNLSNFRDE